MLTENASRANTAIPSQASVPSFWRQMTPRFPAALRQFCSQEATVLDCANGYQKENEEEVDEVEEDCRRQGEADKKTDKESSWEAGKEDGCSEQSCGKKESR